MPINDPARSLTHQQAVEHIQHLDASIFRCVNHLDGAAWSFEALGMSELAAEFKAKADDWRKVQLVLSRIFADHLRKTGTSGKDFDGAFVQQVIQADVSGAPLPMAIRVKPAPQAVCEACEWLKKFPDAERLMVEGAAIALKAKGHSSYPANYTQTEAAFNVWCEQVGAFLVRAHLAACKQTTCPECGDSGEIVLGEPEGRHERVACMHPSHDSKPAPEACEHGCLNGALPCKRTGAKP